MATSPIPSGQGIDVGDAVFSFLADSQDLESGLHLVDTIPSRVAPGEAAVADLSGTLQGMSTYFGQAGEASEAASEEIVNSTQKATFSMREARGEAMLLGEEMGIHLPRHVLGFVATLPGVGEALQAAFAATAVLFLIQALVQGTEKLSNWIGATFIFTQAMKDSDKSIAAMNKTLLEQSVAFEKAKASMEVFGLTGSALTEKSLDALSDSLQKNQKDLQDTENQIYGLGHGFVGVTGDIDEMRNKYNVLAETIKAQTEELALLQKQHDQEQTAEIVKAEEERIATAKTSGMARITLATSEALLKLAITNGSYSQILAVQQKSENDQFQLEMKSIAERISALTFEGDKTKAERAALNAQLEKLIDDHNAKVFDSYAKVFTDIRNAAQALQPQLATIDGEISNDLTKALDAASASAQKLGFTFTGDVAKSLIDTRKAYDDLKKSGQATYSDLLQGQMAVLRAEIEYNKQFGNDTTAAQKQLDALTAAYNKLTGVTNTAHIRAHDFLGQFKEDLKSGVDGMKEFGSISATAFDQLGKSVESAISSALLGQKDIGEALKQATASALASLASQALVKALFYTAEGFAALAGFEEQSAGQYFTAAGIMAGVGVVAGAAAYGLSGGGGGGNNRASNNAPADHSAATQSSGGATNSVNVQRLAVGGLVTRPTLAVIGDSVSGGGATEAAVPLDNPSAMAKIVASLQKAGMTPQSGPSGHTFIIQGLISADNLNKVVQKINKGVNKNQIHLKSSDSLRITKRSN